MWSGCIVYHALRGRNRNTFVKGNALQITRLDPGDYSGLISSLDSVDVILDGRGLGVFWGFLFVEEV